VALFTLGTGCGGAKRNAASERPLPPIDDNLLDLMPAEMSGCLFVNVALFRQSALFPAAEALFGEGPASLLEDAAPFDPLRESSEILFGFSPGANGSDDQFITLVKGTFNKDAVIAAFAKRKGASEGNIRGFKVVRQKKFTVIALTDRTIALGLESLVERVAELAQRSGMSIKQKSYFAHFELDKSATLLLRYEMPSPANAGLPAKRLVHTSINIQGITQVDGRANLGAELAFHVDLDAQNEQDASKLERGLKKDIRSFRRNIFVLFLGLDWLFERIQLTRQGNRIAIDALLSQNDVAELGRLADRLKKIKELATEDLNVPDLGPFKSPTQEAPAEKEEDDQ